MAKRFIPLSIFKAHWRTLSDYTQDKPVADWVTRGLLIGVPLAAAILLLICGGSIASPSIILAGITLLATGALTVYGQVAQHRAILTARMDDYPTTERKERDSLDETVSHLLVIAYLSGLDAVVILIAMSMGATEEGAIQGVWAALIAFITLYIFLTFLILVPRIYAAYTQANKVRKELNGHFKL